MGQAVLKAVDEDSDLSLLGAIDKQNIGVDCSEIAGINSDLKIVDSIEAVNVKADVLVDFTHPNSVEENVLDALGAGLHVVVGTTGLNENQLKTIEEKAKAIEKNVFIAPNFAIGAVLMMELSKKAAKHMANVEIIELHHDQTADAPSGTAEKTAAELTASSATVEGERENLKGSRGGVKNNIRIHSVRLPGLVAHQEVIFGAKGQTLTIRHDTTDRTSFMPGVLAAIKKVPELSGLTYGLENILEI